MDIRTLKDALIDDLAKDGDLSTILWDFAKTFKGRTPWLQYETVERLLFHMFEEHTIDERQLILALSEWMGAFTGRGTGLEAK